MQRAELRYQCPRTAKTVHGFDSPELGAGNKPHHLMVSGFFVAQHTAPLRRAVWGAGPTQRLLHRVADGRYQSQETRTNY